MGHGWVHGEEHIEGIDGGVVVGVDGSQCAREALAYAVEEARRRGTALHVVRAWTISTAPHPRGAEPGYVPSFAEFAQACEEQMRAELHRVGADVPAGGPAVGSAAAAGPPVRIHVVHGHAAHALLEASSHADVVVVGSRGHGGFAGLVLGSTSEQVVRHASCPVVVVRPRSSSHEHSPAHSRRHH